MVTKIKPFFSIIIPALNEEKYLPHLLADLAEQSYRDFEVIVVDGKSDDQTVKKANSYKDSLPALSIITSLKRHVCIQRNLGAQKSTTEWLIFMDADNRIPPYFLQGIKYRIESSTSELFSTWMTPDSQTPTINLMANVVNLASDLQNNIKPVFMIEALIIVKKIVFDKIGGFQENVDYAEGMPFVQTAHKQGVKVQYFKDPIYTFSFRRIKKAGALKFLRNFTQLGLTATTNLELRNKIAHELYPMQGGSVYKNRKQQNKLIKIITKFFREL